MQEEAKEVSEAAKVTVAFLKEYVGGSTDQMELEGKYKSIREVDGQKVARFARDYKLLLRDLQAKPLLKT